MCDKIVESVRSIYTYRWWWFPFWPFVKVASIEIGDQA